MEDYPTTQTQFRQWFSKEQSCHDYLFRLRWPGGFRCPRCRCIKAWVLKRGLLRCSRCDYQSSVTAGTMLQDSHKTLRAWFRAMWYVTGEEERPTAVGLRKILRFGSYRTAWIWMQKLRRAMVTPGRGRAEAAAAKGKKPRRASRSHGLRFCRLLQNAVRMTPVPGRKLRGAVHTPRRKTRVRP